MTPRHVPRRQRLRRGVGHARLLPESPLASIWEGSGNIQCLDVLRAMVKNPASLDAFFAEVHEGAGTEPMLEAYVASLRAELPGDVETIESQASLLVRYGDPRRRRRLLRIPSLRRLGNAFGTLPAGTDFGRILERHRVA